MPVVYRSITFDGSVAHVWAALRDFHEIGWAPGVLETCERVGDRAGTEIGARRILNDSFHETLIGLDDQRREIRYRIADGPSPVSPAEVDNFVVSVRVRPVTASDGTFVSWQAQWDAGDDAACDFAGGIYDALLGALASSLSP